MKTSSLPAVLAACVLATPLLAQAAPTANYITVVERVATGDLDLSQAAGRSRLDARIRDAVNRACGDASAVDLKGRNEVRRCRAETLSLAAAQAERATAAARPAAMIAALDE